MINLNEHAKEAQETHCRILPAELAVFRRLKK